MLLGFVIPFAANCISVHVSTVMADSVSLTRETTGIFGRTYFGKSVTIRTDANGAGFGFVNILIVRKTKKTIYIRKRIFRVDFIGDMIGKNELKQGGIETEIEQKIEKGIRFMYPSSKYISFPSSRMG